MSAFAKLAKVASGTLSQRASMEVAKENTKPPNGDQDYVLVDDDENGRLSARAASRSALVDPKAGSPAPVVVGLQVPDDAADGSGKVELALDTAAVAAWRGSQVDDQVDSVDTDRTDYSGLNEPSRAGSVHSAGSQVLQKALDEANQQHQWAMEAVIRGWESEKADLLQKLRRMTEARDTLETELKHSETSFAGMMDSMLDQKLDQMLAMLHDCGAKPPSPARTAALGSPSGPERQPTVRKAQQVVHDLGSMLEGMKLQQATVEARINQLQSAVLQLLPGSDTPTSRRSIENLVTLGAVSPDAPCSEAPPAERSLVQRSLMRIGSVWNRSRHFACTKGPRAAHAAGDAAAKALTAPLHLASSAAGRTANCLRARGFKNEHITALGGAAAGVLATTVLVKSLGPSRSRAGAATEAPPAECEVREIEITGPDCPEEDGAVEIILNRNGVFRRTGPEEPALIVAWPV